MKKRLYIIVLLLVVVSLTGCGSKTLTCTKTSKESIYTLDEKIVAKYGLVNLKSVEIHQEMDIKDNSLITASMLEKTISSQFKDLKENGAKINVSSKDNKVIVDISIDSSKVSKHDLNNLYDSEVSLEDAKKSFKKLGYTCK